MTEAEFQENLREIKWFDEPQELINHRLPIVQHYLTNHIDTKSGISIMINNQQIKFSQITINPIDANNAEAYKLLNYAYMVIRNIFNYY